jgi:hypothetical protein
VISWESFHLEKEIPRQVKPQYAKWLLLDT